MRQYTKYDISITMTLNFNHSSICTPEVILFDWDGTLIDSAGAHLDIANDLITQYGPVGEQSPWSMKRFTSDSTFHNYKKMVEFFQSNSDHAIKELTVRIDQLKKSEEPVFEYSKEILQLCIDNNIDSYIISSHEEQSLKKHIENLNMTHFFKKIVGGNKELPFKPDVAPIKLAMKDRKELPELNKIWFVGDSLTDVQCAQSFGCIPIKIGYDVENVISVSNIRDVFLLLEKLV